MRGGDIVTLCILLAVLAAVAYLITRPIVADRRETRRAKAAALENAKAGHSPAGPIIPSHVSEQMLKGWGMVGDLEPVDDVLRGMV